jgi:superfamily II DNA or RNA helicase
MELTISNEITITDPTPEIRQWVYDKLKVPNPEYSNKVRLGLWVGNTPKELKLYRASGNSLIIPYGVRASLFHAFTEFKTYEHKCVFATNKPVNYNASIKLYDYQENAVQSLIRSCGGILQSKAGSGKTRMGIALICAMGKKTLWLTHTNELLNQSYNAAAEFIDKKLLGKITAGKIQIADGITFATVQTLSNADLQALRYEWDMVVVDECHRCAGTVNKATMFSKVLNNLAAQYKYGLSATLHRADGLIKCTYALLGGVAHTVPDSVVNTMRVEIQKKETGVQISRKCLDTDGTLVYAKLINYLAEHEERNWQIVDDIVRIAKQHHSIILLSDRVAHLECIYDMLQRFYQVDAVILHGKVKKADREQSLEDMRTKKKHILLATYQLAKEGLDVPCLDRLLLATPVKDYAIVVQSVGRIARVCEGKGTPVVYDYVDDIGFLQGMWKKRCTHYRKDGCIL